MAPERRGEALEGEEGQRDEVGSEEDRSDQRCAGAGSQGKGQGRGQGQGRGLVPGAMFETWYSIGWACVAAKAVGVFHSWWIW